MRSWWAVLAAASVLAGCVSSAPGGPDPGAPAPAFPACQHPWPCADGSEWPTGLEGPFEILPPERAQVRSFDGTLLSGHVWRPDVPDGTRVPVIIHSTPYPAQTTVSVSDAEADPDPSTSYEGYMDTVYGDFVRAGYALLLVNVRGTGESGGCLEWWGENEQRDQAVLVEWAAAQPWSSGRVGFWGLSYSGTTPWEAAIHAPPALKAIWAGGIITDAYLLGYSPQGSANGGYNAFATKRYAENGVIPPVPGVSMPADRWPDWLAVAPERACPGVPDHWFRQAATVHSDDRRADWFDERRLVDRFDDVTAAVLVAHGLQDNSGHRFQEDIIWGALGQAPKWFLLGQWGHTFEFDGQLAGYPHASGHWSLTMDWFDFWLKGLGTPPRLGFADYQDSGGAWHEASAWPPASRVEVLYLGGGALQADPAEGSAPFITPTTSSVELLFERETAYGCSPADPPGSFLVYAAPPAASDVLVAGNPFAWLAIESDRPGGQFAVDLLDLGGAGLCDGPVQVVARGAADLRFHAGNLVAEDFPVGSPTHVRVDFWNTAHLLAAGHRLAVVVRAPFDQEGQPWTPTLTVHGGLGADASQVVLPVVAGTLGGSAPATGHAPRPFTPSP